MPRRAKSGASQVKPLPLSEFEQARGQWRSDVQTGLGDKPNPTNRSGVEIKASTRPKIGRQRGQ